TEPPEGLGVSVDLRQEAGRAGVDLLLPKPLGDKALKERARRLMQEADLAAKAPRRGSIQRGFETTAVIDATLKEIDAGGPQQARPTGGGERLGKGPGDPNVEIEKLRAENVKLKSKLLAAHETIERLRTDVDDLKRRRGPFGRRR